MLGVGRHVPKVPLAEVAVADQSTKYSLLITKMPKLGYLDRTVAGLTNYLACDELRTRAGAIANFW